jgi:ADP-heptose:LPS heptosyltransferase
MIGRNCPCHCGSGKKYKKCCGLIPRILKTSDRKILFFDHCGLGDSLILTSVFRELHYAYPNIALAVETNRPEVYRGLSFVEATTMEKVATLQKAKTDTDLEITIEKFNDAATKLSDYECFNASLNDAPKGFKVPASTSYSTMVHLSLMKKTQLTWSIKNINPEIMVGDILNPVCKTHSGPYWLICAGVNVKESATKQWGFSKYQQLVDLLKNKVKFVQYGKDREDMLCKHAKLAGALSLIGNTSILELGAAFRDCVGCVGPTGSNMHFCAAFGKHSIVIAGGLEHPALNVYPNQKILFNNSLDCVDVLGRKTPLGCSRYRSFECLHWCGDHGACMDSITPEAVAAEILKLNQYSERENL